MSKIQYIENPATLKSTNTYFAEIPTGITTKSDLLDIYAKELKLPGYFGYNWDALDEVLSDFHWIKEKHIVVYHNDLPQLGQSDIQIYLSILDGNSFKLDDLVKSAMPDKVFSLESVQFVFPVKYQEVVEYLTPTKEEWLQFQLTGKLPPKSMNDIKIK